MSWCGGGDDLRLRVIQRSRSHSFVCPAHSRSPDVLLPGRCHVPCRGPCWAGSHERLTTAPDSLSGSSTIRPCLGNHCALRIHRVSVFDRLNDAVETVGGRVQLIVDSTISSWHSVRNLRCLARLVKEHREEVAGARGTWANP